MNRKYTPRALLLFLCSVLLAGILTGFKWMSDQNDEKITIVMFGDSITKGGDWVTLLGRSDVKNSGFPGFTTSHLVWLLKENVIDLAPRVCFLEGGINDIGVGIPLDRTKSNYRSLIDGLKEHQITPVVQSILYQKNNPETGLNAQYTTDGTHINQDAYEIWATEVRNLLKSIL